MEPKDLRLGNLILDPDGAIDKVVGYHWGDSGMGYVFRLDKYPNNPSITIINPIPLTEEWLIKFGFEKSSGRTKHYHHWDNGVTAIKQVLGEFGMEGVFTKYVHSLQNLFFALTQEELTIKQPTTS